MLSSGLNTTFGISRCQAVFLDIGICHGYYAEWSYAMVRKQPAAKAPRKAKTSLSIDQEVYDRAHQYKLDSRRAGEPKDLGDIVTEALDEYLRKRGA
jgi:hypothetical protein